MKRFHLSLYHLLANKTYERTKYLPSESSWRAYKLYGHHNFYGLQFNLLHIYTFIYANFGMFKCYHGFGIEKSRDIQLLLNAHWW